MTDRPARITPGAPRPSVCAALALIASAAVIASVLAAAGLAGETAAQQQDGSDTLLRVAERARDHVKDHLASDSPDVAYELFARGLLHVDHLEGAASAGDSGSAEEHFLAAMTSFKIISERLHEHEQGAGLLNGTLPAGPPTAAIAASTHPEGDLARLRLYTDTLKTVSESMGAPVDFAPLDALFEQAQQLASQGLPHTAGGIIPEIREGIVRIDSELRDHSSGHLLMHAKEYAMMHIDRVDSILEQADALQIPPGIISELEDARRALAAAHTPDQIRDRVVAVMEILER